MNSNNTTEYSKIIQKLESILYNDDITNFEKKLQIVNEIINPLYDKAFDLIIELDKIKKENEKLKRKQKKLEKEVSDAGWREEAARERAWIERGDDGMD